MCAGSSSVLSSGVEDSWVWGAAVAVGLGADTAAVSSDAALGSADAGAALLAELLLQPANMESKNAAASIAHNIFFFILYLHELFFSMAVRRKAPQPCCHGNNKQSE